VLNLILPLTRDSDILATFGLTPYSFRLSMLFYPIVIISSILIIIKKRKQIKHIDIIIGLILAISASFHRRDSILFLATSLPYIASMSIFNSSEIKMILFKRISRKAFVIIASILIVSLVASLLHHYGALRVSSAFIRTLAPGIMEEIVFRMFLFSIAVWIIEGHTGIYTHNKLVIYLIMIIPFVIYHHPDILVEDGFRSFISVAISMFPIATIMTLFAVKRDLASAVVIHIVYNFIIFIGIENPIENIWQHNVPSLLQLLYAIVRFGA